MRVVAWLLEGTWPACVDATARHAPADADITLLYVTPAEISETADAAAAGLLGRALPERQVTQRIDRVLDEEASAVLAGAAERLGRADVELVHRHGRVELEVVRAVARDVDVLVLTRDGDRSRLGPRSLGPATRFVVDHAPCAVLLVWPDEPPGMQSMLRRPTTRRRTGRRLRHPARHRDRSDAARSRSPGPMTADPNASRPRGTRRRSGCRRVGQTA